MGVGCSPRCAGVHPSHPAKTGPYQRTLDQSVTENSSQLLQHWVLRAPGATRREGAMYIGRRTTHPPTSRNTCPIKLPSNHYEKGNQKNAAKSFRASQIDCTIASSKV